MDIVSRYKQKGVYYLYYICHVNNLRSIVKYGLLSKNLINKNNIIFYDVSNRKVQARRDTVVINNKLKLHDYVNLYFDPRNPMMYTLYCHDKTNSLCILCLDTSLLECEGVIVTDGNAAAELTHKNDAINGLNEIDFNRVFAADWTALNNRAVYFENKRIKCAEILIKDSISFEYVKKIIVPNNNVKMYVDSLNLGVNTEINDYLFFIGEKITYV